MPTRRPKTPAKTPAQVKTEAMNVVVENLRSRAATEELRARLDAKKELAHVVLSGMILQTKAVSGLSYKDLSEAMAAVASPELLRAIATRRRYASIEMYRKLVDTLSTVSTYYGLPEVPSHDWENTDS